MATAGRCSIEIPGTVFTVGDHAYPSGTTKEFQDCYDTELGSSQGADTSRPGNHDYLTANAKAYFDYFGDSAGPERRGYYSYTLGSLAHRLAEQLICGRSPFTQIEWLRQDLKEQSRDVYARLLAHPGVQLRPSW